MLLNYECTFCPLCPWSKEQHMDVFDFLSNLLSKVWTCHFVEMIKNHVMHLNSITKVYIMVLFSIRRFQKAKQISLQVWILCNDCNDTTEVNFHIIGHKCGHCSSYNTRAIAPPVLPQWPDSSGFGDRSWQQ